MNASSCLPWIGLVVLASPSLAAGDPAIQIQRLIGEGDVLPGLGTIATLYDYRVTDEGDWYVRAYVDAPTDSDLLVLIHDGVVVWSEHDPVPQPPGATIYNFYSWDAAASGALAGVLWLYGTVDYTDDHIALVDGTVLAQESKPLNLAGLSPGSVWQQLIRLRMNDERQVLVMGEVDDPAFPNPYTDALVRYDLSAGGGVAGKSLQLIQGASVAGAAETVASISDSQFHLNDGGDVLALVALDAPNEVNDTILLNGAVYAREGGPSVVPGLSWPTVQPSLLGLNARSDVCFLWGVDAGGFVPVLVRNQEAFAAKGDVLQATAPHGLDAFPWATLNDRGDLVWQGNWQPVSPVSWAQKAVFLNTKALAQANSTVVDGKVLLDLGAAIPSDGGRYVAFTAKTSLTVDELYRVDLGPWSELEIGALAGAEPAPALVGIGALAPFAPTTLRVEGGTPGTVAAVVLGLTQSLAPVLGTTLVPSPDVMMINLPVDADGAVELSFAFPPGLAPGTEVFAQAFVQDPGTPFGWASSYAIRGVTP
jgi:hypothetical protein